LIIFILFFAETPKAVEKQDLFEDLSMEQSLLEAG